jgi:imidazolonepropionase-like amidohydrolase
MIDGREEDKMRIAVYDSTQSRKAVDSLVSSGVDFIKTHQALTTDCYFAVLREAKKKHIKVVSHMTPAVPVWLAVDSGLTCVEHAAESFLPAPISAGIIKGTGDSALFASIDWWRSSQGDSIINHLGKLHIFFTPTLVTYKYFILDAKDQASIEEREKVFVFLKELTLKLKNAGAIILVESDFGPTDWPEIPGKSLLEEIELLQEAGLTKQETIDAATINFLKWLKS